MLVSGLCLSSCKTYTGSYSLSPKSVNVNTDQDVQSLTFTETFQNKKPLLTFEDEMLAVRLQYNNTEFFFDIENKTDDKLLIDLDHLLLVDADNYSSRLLPSDWEVAERIGGLNQRIIPEGTKHQLSVFPQNRLEEKIRPISSTSVSTHHNQVQVSSKTVAVQEYWYVNSYLPNSGKGKAKTLEMAKSYCGKDLYILMPVVYKGQRSEYKVKLVVDYFIINNMRLKPSTHSS